MSREHISYKNLLSVFGCLLFVPIQKIIGCSKNGDIRAALDVFDASQEYGEMELHDIWLD